MGILVLVFELVVFRTMLGIEVLMPLLMCFVQFAVKPAMLPLRHRALMPGFMCIA